MTSVKVQIGRYARGGERLTAIGLRLSREQTLTVLWFRVTKLGIEAQPNLQTFRTHEFKTYRWLYCTNINISVIIKH